MSRYEVVYHQDRWGFEWHVYDTLEDITVEEFFHQSDAEDLAQYLEDEHQHQEG